MKHIFMHYQFLLLFSIVSVLSSYAETSKPLYLRGDINEWGYGPRWEFNTMDGEVYTLNNIFIPAGSEFKIADSEWKDLDFGGSVVSLNSPIQLSSGGGNITIDYAGVDYQSVNLSFNIKDKMLTITPGVLTSEMNGVELIDLGLSVKWAPCNVGADFSNPENEFKDGHYFGWGDTEGSMERGKFNVMDRDWYYYDEQELIESGIIDERGNLTPTYDAATVNMGKYWRTPTANEMHELIDKCEWILNEDGSYTVIGPNKNSINFSPCGEYIRWDYGGDFGVYMTSTPVYTSNENKRCYVLDFENERFGIYSQTRWIGKTVRAVSDVGVGNIIINRCEPVVIEVNGNNVTMSCATEGATIYYTLNGSNPGANSRLMGGGETVTSPTKEYTEPFTINKNCLIRAVAKKEWCDDSVITEYQMNEFTTSKPEFSFNKGILSITSATPNASIYYTFGNEKPTEYTTLYSAPIALTDNKQINAVALADGFNPSEISTYKPSYFKCGDVHIEIKNNIVTMSCTTDGVSIFYTLDGTNPIPPSSDSDSVSKEILSTIEYTGPFTINKNYHIRAIAKKMWFEDSSVSEFHVNIFNTSNPEFNFNKGILDITCKTPNASIYYSFNDVVPTENSTLYEGSITLTDNRKVNAVAIVDGYNPSEIVTYQPSYFVCEPVSINIDDYIATMSCTTNSATIYYTMDGTKPEVSYNASGEIEFTNPSTEIYEKPFRIDRNCHICAIAKKLWFIDSQINEYQINDFTTSNPEFEFNMGILTITCATPDASIYYNIGDENPSEFPILYNGPITLTDNRKISAIAVANGFNQSEVRMYQPSYFTCNSVLIDFNDNIVSMSCITNGVDIYYTLDGTNPTPSSNDIGEKENDRSSIKLYSSPFSVDKNCHIRAVAKKKWFNDSLISELLINEFTVSNPEFEYNNDVLTIKCSTPNAFIYYTIGNETPSASSTLYNAPITLKDNRNVNAIAIADGFNPSEVVTYSQSNFICDAAKIYYDGRKITIDYPSDCDIEVISYDLNNNVSTIVYTGPFDAKGISTLNITAHKSYFIDNTISYDIPAYFDGEEAIVLKKNELKSAFGWTDVENIESVKISGEIGPDDWTLIKSMSSLDILDIKDVTKAEIPEDAFAGLGFRCVIMPESITSVGDNILGNCPNLSSLVWNADIPLNDDILSKTTINPNMIVYINNKDLAPKKANNIVVNGYAEKISLVAQQSAPFYCYSEFNVEEITYTRDFLLNTPYGGCGGWETIVLPFDVKDITYYNTFDNSVRTLKPFALLNGDFSEYNPFWLMSMSSEGFTNARVIKANIPYIISMPNNDRYPDVFNVNGAVTFKSNQCKVLATEFEAIKGNGIEFIPTYSYIPKNNDIFALNVMDPYESEYVPGSIFIKNYDYGVSPFEAYLKGNSIHRIISISQILDDEVTGIESVIPNSKDIEINVEGNTIYITSNTIRNLAIYTISGIMIRNVELNQGLNVVSDLMPGLYLINKQKVLVK